MLAFVCFALIALVTVDASPVGIGGRSTMNIFRDYKNGRNTAYGYVISPETGDIKNGAATSGPEGGIYVLSQLLPRGDIHSRYTIWGADGTGSRQIITANPPLGTYKISKNDILIPNGDAGILG